MEALNSVDEWLKVVGLRALSSEQTVRASYDIARLAIERGVPGDFVECGIFAGVQSAAMAKAIMDPSNPVTATEAASPHWPRYTRKVHLFDSFEGIPEPGEFDQQFFASGVKAGLSACSLSAVQSHMSGWGIPPELLVYHPGWFKDTIPLVAAEMAARDQSIAVLRLDADLYESTKVCLEYLYPLVSKGGWVVVDDFALSGCRKAVDEYLAYPPVYFVKDV